MKAWVPLVLQALSFAAAFAEVVLPSFGVLTVLSLGLFAWSWVLLVEHFGPRTLAAVGIADLLLIPVIIRLGFAYLGKSPISHRTDLGRGSGLESVDSELGRHVGAMAVADTDLRPTGRIRIGEETYEAHTSGEWVGRGTQVKVTAVSGSRFLVEKPNA